RYQIDTNQINQQYFHTCIISDFFPWGKSIPGHVPFGPAAIETQRAAPSAQLQPPGLQYKGRYCCKPTSVLPYSVFPSSCVISRSSVFPDRKSSNEIPPVRVWIASVVASSPSASIYSTCCRCSAKATASSFSPWARIIMGRSEAFLPYSSGHSCTAPLSRS